MTGKMLFMNYKSVIYILMYVILHLPLSVSAQAVSFTASANKTNVQIGEQFKVTFSINAKANGFTPPSFTGFLVVSGPNPSTQSSMQWINGNFTQSVTQSYSYILEANTEGSYTIGAASISAGNSTYKSNPITINVSKGQQQASGQPSQGTTPSQKNQTSSVSTGSDDELFVRTYVSRSKVFKGEQITLTHKLYTSLPRVDLVDIKPPSYSGFWSEQIDGGRQITPQNEVLNGKNYRVAEISKTVLFPQKDGTIRIEPIQVECDVQTIKQRNANSFMEEMFYGPKVSYYTNERRKIKSNPITINVTNLPLKGKPADFAGAVGNFNISAEISKTELKANEALDFKITISGNGNIKLIDKLNVDFPTDFEVYNPKIMDAVNVTGAGVSGKRSFEYVIIPLHEGNFEIKPINFSYFNAKLGNYNTISTPEFKIIVGKGSQRSNQLVTSSQQDVKYINSDIRYIKTKPFVLSKSGNIFWGSNPYFSLFAIPPLLFLGFMLLYRKQMQLKSDIAYIRNRKARKTAKLKLKKAKQYFDANKCDEFYVEISQALWGYAADKFNIPVADLSLQNIQIIMMQKNIPAEKQSVLIKILEECEFARFAPGNNSENMNKLYSGAIDVITSFES